MLAGVHPPVQGTRAEHQGSNYDHVIDMLVRLQHPFDTRGGNTQHSPRQQMPRSPDADGRLDGNEHVQQRPQHIWRVTKCWRPV